MSATTLTNSVRADAIYMVQFVQRWKKVGTKVRLSMGEKAMRFETKHGVEWSYEVPDPAVFKEVARDLLLPLEVFA